jgi:hypothetical protein
MLEKNKDYPLFSKNLQIYEVEFMTNILVIKNKND